MGSKKCLEKYSFYILFEVIFGADLGPELAQKRGPKMELKTAPSSAGFQGFLAPTKAGSPKVGGPGIQENEKSSCPFIYK